MPPAQAVAIATQHRLPVVISDVPLHRRVRVHYLWLPDHPDPRIHASLTELLTDVIRNGHRALAIAAPAAYTDGGYYSLTLQPPDGGTPDG